MLGVGVEGGHVIHDGTRGGVLAHLGGGGGARKGTSKSSQIFIIRVATGYIYNATIYIITYKKLSLNL